MSNYRVETGFQLFARLTTRPNIENIYPDIFANNEPKGKQVIEIVGDTSTGKTFLITELLAKCLLPAASDDINIGGKNAGAIIINTDHHFQVFNLIRIMESLLKKCNKNDAAGFTSTQINDIITTSLRNLIVLNCFDSHQLLITFHNLENIVSKNHKVSLLVLDSLSAYYWGDRLNGGLKRIDLYQKNMLKLLQTVTREYNLTIVFTKYSGFFSKTETLEDCSQVSALEKVNYRILLERKKEDNIFSASVTFPDNTKTVKMYKIADLINWIEQT